MNIVEQSNYQENNNLPRNELRGYDPYWKLFFVDVYNFPGITKTIYFKTLEEYTQFLNGDVYESANYMGLEGWKTTCASSLDYTMANIEKKLIEKKQIDQDYIYNFKQLLSFFRNISTEKLIEMVRLLQSKMNEIPNYQDLIMQFVLSHYQRDQNSFLPVLKLLNGRANDSLVEKLSYFYDLDEIANNYKVTNCCEATTKKHARWMKKYKKEFQKEECKWYKTCKYNAETDLFVITVHGKYTGSDGNIYDTEPYNIYLDSFSEVKQCAKEIKILDIHDAFNILYQDLNEFNCKIILPIEWVKEDNRSVSVKENKIDHTFEITLVWECEYGIIDKKSFALSHYCDLIYLFNEQIPEIVKEEEHKINFDVIHTSELGLNGEIKTIEDLALSAKSIKSDIKIKEKYELGFANEPQHGSEEDISYITDLHLLHYCMHHHVDTFEQMEYVIDKITNNLIENSKSILLIGGDISGFKPIDEFFIKSLGKKLKPLSKTIIFVLGNHDFATANNHQTTNDIVNYYKRLIEENHMFLLHNNILYFKNVNIKNPKSWTDNMKIHEIKETDLFDIGEQQLTEEMQDARLIFFGGTGFAAYDPYYNAEHIIYHNTFSKLEELAETSKFESLYHKVVKAATNRNLIILTHMPFSNWCKDPYPAPGLVFVSGHTHRNQFYDDGITRIYADNQFGYNKKTPNKEISLKNFRISLKYDKYADYKDGIYIIDNDEYNLFYRSINLPMTSSQSFKIYMLKKDGYYCFIRENKKGELNILNAGRAKKLEKKDIKYYYDSMGFIINKIQDPFKEYNEYQKHLAKIIQQLGGDGKIHGCIIDIDWFNHIYVDPIDLCYMPYYAVNICERIPYNTIPELLKTHSPHLYLNYQRLMIEGNSEGLSIIENNCESYIQEKQETMYYASYMMNKIQKLDHHILTFWDDKIITEYNRELKFKRSNSQSKKRIDPN